MAETTGKADGSTDSYLAMLSASAGCDCTFGATINANVLPNNTYGIATRGYVDASIKKHDEDKDAHDFMLSGFVSEINGLKPVNHSLSLSSIRCTDVYGEVISELRSDGTGTVNGSSVRYATTDSISSIVEKVVKPFEAASASWNGAASTVSSCSAIWNAASTETTTSSANWSSVYATVSAASAGWDGGGEAKVKADSVYATVSSCSAEWEGRQEQIYVDNDDEDEISPWVDTTPKTDTVNRLVTSRGVAEALFGKMGNSFPVSVYQNGKKYKVSIGDDGAGNIGFVVTSGDSYPIRWRYQNLTNTNTAAYAYDKEPYRGKLVADDNCVLSGMWCTMGGEQQTVSADGTIAIPSVTGDVFIGGYALSNNKGNWNENGNVLTLATDSYLDTATSSVLHLGKFAISMDGSEIILNCGTLKMPFFVTYDLENATSTSSVTSLQPETPYSTLLSADYGYSMATSSCTMGGVPQPIVDGSVSIASVTGDISVKAHANLSSEAYFSSDTTCTLKLPSDTRYSPSDKTLFFGKSTSGEAPSGFTMRGSRSHRTFTVTNSLTGCTNNNSSIYAIETRPYNATIVPNFGQKLDYVTCTMGGETVAVAGGVISIPSVEGNISIAASASIAELAYYSTSTNTLVLPSDTVATAESGIVLGNSVSWNGNSGTLSAQGGKLPFFSITNSLTGCASTNTAASIEECSSYSATIYALDGYELSSLSCTMGGVPQTVTGWTISIPSVTGAIVVNGGAKPVNYLRLTSVSGGSTVDFSYASGTDVEYSKNGGEWTACGSGTRIELENGGDYVSYRGNLVKTDLTNHFTITGGYVVGSGSATSLIDKCGVDASVQLSDSSFSNMFTNSTALVSAPSLPSTTLSSKCYMLMFSGCSSLTAAPLLPATTLSDWCYVGMFNGCTSLATPPSLPSTELAEKCYYSMFLLCSALTAAPSLPATTLNASCYSEMFQSCTSLTAAPELLATALASDCYDDMFYGCTAITSVDMRAVAGYTANAHGRLAQHTIAINYIDADYLKLTSLDGGSTVQLGYLDGTNFEYSKNGGDWIHPTAGYPTIQLENAGDNVRCRGLGIRTRGHAHFTVTGGRVAGSGSVNSLVDGHGANPSVQLKNSEFTAMFEDSTALVSSPKLPSKMLSDNCYYSMFSGCTSLTAAPELPALSTCECCYDNMFIGCKSLTEPPLLPASSVAKWCYRAMFYGCTSLTSAPELTAEALSESCYDSMFYGCSSLTAAPELPATVLANSCYSQMFNGCTKLSSVPNLSATVLENYCCDSMFLGCASLTAAPELPSTTLSDYCYRLMFKDCSALTEAPELPAKTLATNCYNSMFYGCSSLTAVPELPATTLANKCYNSMFYGCSSLTAAPELPATALANNCYNSMFYYCTSVTSVTMKNGCGYRTYLHGELGLHDITINYVD